MDKCKKHPRYRGIYKSRTHCRLCNNLYSTVHAYPEKTPWYERLLQRFQ